MSLATDLMGLGIAPVEAEKTSTAGSGPLAATATGTTAAGGYVLKAAQNLTYFTTAGSAQACVLHTVSYLGDAWVIHNSTSTNLLVFTPVGVTLNMAGVQVTNTSAYSVGQYHTMNVWSVNSVTYVGQYA